MARHRAARRREGLRPVQIWLPETRTAEFAKAARRACEIVNGAPDSHASMDWLECVGVIDEADGAG
ncbi:MAG: DUF3018 family protein [Alphaproteobacteria bacterium]|nr:DUF3018 family protein [Alphaproteobacteria bacterium]